MKPSSGLGPSQEAGDQATVWRGLSPGPTGSQTGRRRRGEAESNVDVRCLQLRRGGAGTGRVVASRGLICAAVAAATLEPCLRGVPLFAALLPVFFPPAYTSSQAERGVQSRVEGQTGSDSPLSPT